MSKKNKVKLIFILVILISVIIFFLQNSLMVDVDFLFFNLVSVSIIKLNIIFFALGFLIGLYCYHSYISWKNNKNELKNALKLDPEGLSESDNKVDSSLY